MWNDVHCTTVTAKTVSDESKRNELDNYRNFFAVNLLFVQCKKCAMHCLDVTISKFSSEKTK